MIIVDSNLSFFLLREKKNNNFSCTATMSSDKLLPSFLIPLSVTFLVTVFTCNISNAQKDQYPFSCSQDYKHVKICNASLYHINKDQQIEEVASYYSVNTSQITQIFYGGRQDYLIMVPCTCENISGIEAYFYDANYTVEKNDTFEIVSDQIYSGQAWEDGYENGSFIIGNEVPMHLLCGCQESKSQIVTTYTVQQNDILSGIASRLSSTTSDILRMNKYLIKDQDVIVPGWVLFVPRDLNSIPSSPFTVRETSGKKTKRTVIISVLSVAAFLLMTALIIIFLRRKMSQRNIEEEPKAVSKSLSTTRLQSLQTVNMEIIEDRAAFDSEKPMIYSIEEIEESTNNFDETRIIGAGGYGSVYFGVMVGGQEVAIKKMKSNKSKEFFAELKVLCKVHHINVVELLGYACGDDHLYLVYEYIHNGSLCEHVHDPLLKGYQPLSWTARVQIALDAAKGIEYIHDHTKKRYVHRDIKSSNILLDEGLRAKVADFGLAKLVERTNDDEDLIATRLVGTPGYLPPESVKELQVTTKTDVFAFGVVLAELLTGQRALVRDNCEPTKMRSLITVVYKIFEDDDPETALENAVDGNLRGSFPMDDMYKMAEIVDWCLKEDPINRPEMRDVIPALSSLLTSSVEWEASLGGNSQVFSGIYNGR